MEITRNNSVGIYLPHFKRLILVLYRRSGNLCDEGCGLLDAIIIWPTHTLLPTDM